MKNYRDLKGGQGSAILEALNRGNGNSVSTFGSVDQFISGILGNGFKREVPQPFLDNGDSEKKPVEKSSSTYIRMPGEFSDKKDDVLTGDEEEKEEIEEIEDEEEEIINHESKDSSYYKVYRDREETFECNISVQGAKISNSQVRLIFDHELCNVIFYGKVYKDGKCAVPLKKMSFYPEESVGRVRLEVIVDDTIFIPWEETFTVEGSKKVTVQVKSQKKVDFRLT